MTESKEPSRGLRTVDVVLQVTEPAKPSETVIHTQTTYSKRNGRAQNRAKARERLNRPEGTKISVVASGESGEFDDLIDADRSDGGPSDGVA